MAKKVILSGMRPTGPLHLGNLAGALWNTNIPMAPPVPPDALAQRHRERRGKNTRSLFLALCVLCASARRNHTPYAIH